jgi:general nucleoside transport system permease protein
MNAAQLGFWAILLAGAVRLATPITLAALGETLVERCGCGAPANKAGRWA